MSCPNAVMDGWIGKWHALIIGFNVRVFWDLWPVTRATVTRDNNQAIERPQPLQDHSSWPHCFEINFATTF